MKNIIYYFTGTGNSLSISRKLAFGIGDCSVIPVSEAIEGSIESADIVGVVCPNYSYDVPHIVGDFFKKLRREGSYQYLFVTVSAGGDFGFISRKIQKRLRGAGLKSIFQHYMPFNYLPFGDITPKEKQEEQFIDLEAELNSSLKIIKNRDEHIDNKFRPFSKYMKFIYNLAYPLIPQLDRIFSVTGSCNGCNICMKICPVNNIEMKKSKPKWNHRCEQCYACIHWCPEKAILCGKKSRERGRYHHRDILLKDMLIDRFY